MPWLPRQGAFMPIQDSAPSTSRSSADRQSAFEVDGRDSNQFISLSPSVRKLITRAGLVASHLRFASIDGEAGTGKQALATFLYLRAVAAYPAIARSGFNRCDAREWLLSETDPRSITGFTYLDRIDLLGVPGQALLLRSLKGLDTLAPGVAILVTSSELPIRELSAKGQFLSDLAFRLAAIQFTVPPLRERREDILPLSRILLDRIRRRYHLQDFTLASDAITRLLQHDWPGNVRELSSVLESAVLECTDGVIREEDLWISSAPAPLDKPLKTPQALNLDSVIHKHVRYVLELNHGNKLKAARQLGISRSTLYRMLESVHSVSN